jgi:nucleoside permease NupC
VGNGATIHHRSRRAKVQRDERKSLTKLGLSANNNFRWEPGRSALECIGSKVNRFLSFTDEGSQFLFGYLVNQQPFITRRLDPAGLAYNVTMEINEAKAILPVIMFKSVSVLYFFSFMVGMLTPLGAIQVSIVITFPNFSRQ